MLDVFSAFGSAFWEVLSWNTFSLLLAGTVIGFFVGILPGLGGPATLALLLPFTLTMPPAGAFAFLLGMMTVTGTTGDITSILFGIPGEPHTAATILDGHPMAKQGQAGRAIGAALMSSLLGAWVGAFALALAIPIFRPLILLVGYGEFFMLTVVAVCLVASLSGASLLKGIAAGGLGFLVSMVGLDAITGIQRYTFDQVYLWDGLGLATITLGLFAIPEIIELAAARTSVSRSGKTTIGGVMEGIKDTFRHILLTLRCSVLGTALALIPGMGASVCQWVVYAHAVQSRPGKKDQFGKGAVEGVLGPGAANNSSLGGHLIPTVAFGIPGGVVMAILLGAFLIQGIVPGPAMLTPEREGGHLTLTLSFVWTIVFANVIAVLAVLIFLRPIIKLTHVRASLLVPFVILIVFVGAFADDNSFSSFVIMLVSGLLGWLMVNLDWPRAPFLLGLVLGPLLENNLFLAIGSQGAAWLLKPGVIGLLCLALAVLFIPFIRRKSGKTPSEHKEPSSSSYSLTADMWFIAAMIAVVVAALWLSWDWPWRSRLLPWIVEWPTLALLTAQLFLVARKWRARPLAGATLATAQDPNSDQAVSVAWASIVGVFLAIWLLGFYFAVPLTVFLYLRRYGGERLLLAVGLAMVAWAAFGWLFGCVLTVPFPEGEIVTFLEKLTGIEIWDFLREPTICRLISTFG